MSEYWRHHAAAHRIAIEEFDQVLKMPVHVHVHISSRGTPESGTLRAVFPSRTDCSFFAPSSLRRHLAAPFAGKSWCSFRRLRKQRARGRR